MVLNGPNLNLLGTREPGVYGANSLSDIQAACEATAEELGLGLQFRHSNHEGQLIDWVQDAGREQEAGRLIGAVFNPGAYTHTSIALHDAIKGVQLSVIEVHLSNVHAREVFRRTSYIAPVAIGSIAGLGLVSYTLAIRALQSLTEWR